MAGPEDPGPGGQVILVHGLFGSQRMMSPLERFLSRAGYGVRNWGYRSARARVGRLARLLAGQIEALDRSGNVPVHLVGHSLGAIIVRAALQIYTPPAPGRLVMLAPPNRGSHVARRIAHCLGWLVPALQELSDVEGSLVNGLSEQVGCEFGIIIAGKDRVIRSGSALLPGAADQLILASQHWSLPWQPETWFQTGHFLATGRFLRKDIPQDRACRMAAAAGAGQNGESKIPARPANLTGWRGMA